MSQQQQQLSANQIAYLSRAMSDGKGLIEIGELARGLGKQKGNVIKKLERIFSEERLLKLKTVRWSPMVVMVLCVKSLLTCLTIRPLALWLCHMMVS